MRAITNAHRSVIRRKKVHTEKSEEVEKNPIIIMYAVLLPLHPW